MSEIHRRRPWLYKCEFSFVRNDRRPSQKSGTRWENINAPDSPDLIPSIPDARRYLRFLVFISRQNLGQSGNSKIFDTLECSRHMKTRLSRKKSFTSEEAVLWIKLMKVFFGWSSWADSLGRESLFSLRLFCLYITTSDILLYQYTGVSKWGKFLTLWLSNLIFCYSPSQG